VRSSVTIGIVEGDGIESRTQGKIRRQIDVEFDRAELISLRPARLNEKGEYQTIAYLNIERYRSAVDLEITRTIRELTSLIEAGENAPSPERFVRLWSEIRQKQRSLNPQLAQYRTITQTLPDSYTAILPRMIALEKRALKRRQSAHVVIEVSGDFASRQVNDLIKLQVRDYGVRVSGPGHCLKGDLLLLIETGTSDSVHQLTGGKRTHFKWAASLHECGEQSSDRREIAIRELPTMIGVERYNRSASRVIMRQISNWVKLSKPNSRAKHRNKSSKKQFNELLTSIHDLLAITIPAP
jgi:hypothetical protein